MRVTLCHLFSSGFGLNLQHPVSVLYAWVSPPTTSMSRNGTAGHLVQFTLPSPRQTPNTLVCCSGHPTEDLSSDWPNDSGPSHYSAKTSRSTFKKKKTFVCFCANTPYPTPPPSEGPWTRRGCVRVHHPLECGVGKMQCFPGGSAEPLRDF